MNDRLETFCAARPGERLDVFLAACLPDFSRARLQGLIVDGFVLLDGSPVLKAGTRLKGGESVSVRIPPPAPVGLQAEAIPLDILFENEALLVLNKPAGLVVHPAAGHQSGTLVNAVLAHDPDLEGIGGEERPGIVHRLDKDTSGVMVIAKTENAMRWLTEQFKNRLVRKTYLALVDGAPPTPTGRVETPIGRDPHDRKKMAVVKPEKGRQALSEYHTRQAFARHTLLEFHPLTGRTHQIRVHCAFLGCPIVGDEVYGRRKASLPLKRHFLHAWRLELTLPGEEAPRTFEAPLPAELQAALQQAASAADGARLPRRG